MPEPVTPPSLLPPPPRPTALASAPVAHPAWREPVTVGAVVAAATGALAVGNPNTTHVPLCPFRAVTGLDCPFCGSLRAVHALTHLHLGEALSHNLLFTASVPFLVVAWATWLHRSIAGRGGRPTLPRWGVVALLVVVAAFGVVRNVPAFGWLGSSA